MNAVKRYFIGHYLAKADNVFENARVEVVYKFSLILMLIIWPFQLVLISAGYKIQALINTFPCILLFVIFFLLRKGVRIQSVAWLYIVTQLGNSLVHAIVYNFSVSLQGSFWMMLGVQFAFFMIGRKAGLIAALVVVFYLLFTVINTECGFCYFNAGFGEEDVLPESAQFVIMPLALNIYLLWLFIRTTSQAEVQLLDSNRRNEELLLNILPYETAQELKHKGSSDARYYDQVTVLFADIRNFSQLATQMKPTDLVSELHACFKSFDEIISSYPIEKIKTIGDAYLCASGLNGSDGRHALHMVQAAQQFLESSRLHNQMRKAEGKQIFEFRIGIHTGPIVAGVVGIKKFAYDIWGDTVNTAARMQEAGEPNRINLSEHTYELVKDQISCEFRGSIEVKNKGSLKMYFVDNRIDGV